MSTDWTLLDSIQSRLELLPTLDAPIAVWFLDIDGVINIIGPRPRQGWPRYENTHAASDGLAFPVCFAPRLVSCLNILNAKRIVQFRWLTTWEHDGPDSFAPAVGLRLGAILARPVEAEGGFGWFKYDAVMEYATRGGLYIWTDDDIDGFLTEEARDRIDPDQGLVLCPDELAGLTPAEFDIILTEIERALSD